MSKVETEQPPQRLLDLSDKDTATEWFDDTYQTILGEILEDMTDDKRA